MRRGSNGGETRRSALVASPEFGSRVLSASAVVAYVAVGAAAILGRSVTEAVGRTRVGPAAWRREAGQRGSRAGDVAHARTIARSRWRPACARGRRHTSWLDSHAYCGILHPAGDILLAPSVQARKDASRAFAVSPIGIAERFDEHGFFLRGALHHRHGDCADACRNNQPVRGDQSETGKHRYPEAIHRVSDPGIRPLHDELVTSPNS